MLYEFNQTSPHDIRKHLAESFKQRRLEKGYSRPFLAKASGVPAPSIARFEQKYAISLDSFVRLAQTLGYDKSLYTLFDSPVFSTVEELEEIKQNKNRKRGRRNENH